MTRPGKDRACIGLALLATFIVSELGKVSCTSEVALIIRPATMFMVWSDRGSGAERDIAVYSPSGPSGCLRLGDSAVPHYNTGAKPRGYCVEEVLPGSLATPIRALYVWDDRGSGANLDGSFWRFECPPGYVGLGHAISGHYRPPILDNYRCINSSLTITDGAPLKFIWSSRKSGARQDVTVLGLNCHAPSGTEFNDIIVTFDTLTHYQTSSRCVPRAFYQIENGIAVKQVEILNIAYDVEKRTFRGQKSRTGSRTMVSNCFASGVPQTPVEKVSVTYEVSDSWTWHATMSVGTTVIVSATVPFDAGEAEVSLSTTVTNGRNHTSTKSEIRTYETDALVHVPMGKKIAVTATLYLNHYDVPFVAEAAYHRADGHVTYGQLTGLYSGFEIGYTIFAYGELLTC